MSNPRKEKLNSSAKKGMTLIEVIIVIAIVGIMSAISIVSYTTSKRNAELETAAEELVAVLREAQNYSLTGKEISSSCSNYRVTLTNNSSNYVLRTYTAAGVSCGNINSAYVFKSGVIISAGGGYVSFAAPHSSITRTAGVLSGSLFRITLSKGGGFYYVCFNNTSGLIKKTINSNCN